jgi:hypothetical protein
MDVKRSKKPAKIYFLFLVLSLSLFPRAFAQQKVRPDDRGQEASASQAQATMASLFGRGAKMPGIPNASGTIALAPFDSSNLIIDEGILNAVERQESEDIAQRQEAEEAAIAAHLSRLQKSQS